MQKIEFQPLVAQKNGTSKSHFKTDLGALNRKIWAFYVFYPISASKKNWISTATSVPHNLFLITFIKLEDQENRSLNMIKFLVTKCERKPSKELLSKPHRPRQIKQADRQAKQRKVVKKRVKSETQDIRASERNKPLKQRQAIWASRATQIKAKKES